MLAEFWFPVVTPGVPAVEKDEAYSPSAAGAPASSEFSM